MSWSDLEKGDKFYALIFEPRTNLYTYQEISVIQNKLNTGAPSYGSVSTLLFKITKEGKRVRTKIYITPNNTKDKVILGDGPLSQYGSNIYALSKQDLIIAYQHISYYQIKLLEQQIHNNLSFIKHLRNHVKEISLI